MAHDGRHSADDRLLILLASGSTVRDAAQPCDIGETTVWRRLKDATFVAELNRLRAELWNSALGKLTEASGAAVNRLALLIDQGESDAVRLSASVKVLESNSATRSSSQIGLTHIATKSSTTARLSGRFSFMASITASKSWWCVLVKESV